jgi:hypothetical protein
MLSQESNEILTRVGPGTPMGNLLRRFWIPGLLEQEIVERDGAPVKLRTWSPSEARREKSESSTPIARIVAGPCAWAATGRLMMAPQSRCSRAGSRTPLGRLPRLERSPFS